METKNINQYVQELEEKVRLLESAIKADKMIYNLQVQKVKQLEEQLESNYKTIDFKDWVIDDLSTKLRKAHDEIEILDNSSILKEIEESNK